MNFVDINMMMSNPKEELNKLEAMSNEKRFQYFLELFKQMESHDIVLEYERKLPYSERSRYTNQIYRAGEIAYYERIAGNVDEKVSKLEGNVVTISYVTEFSDEEHDGYANLSTTRSASKVECQVRIDEKTGEIAEVLSAKKVKVSNYQNDVDGFRKKHSKTKIVSTEELPIDQVDMELLNKNFHFQREVVLPKLKISQEACHRMSSIVKDSVECYSKKSVIFINPNGEIIENPVLRERESDIDFGDGDFSYEYSLEEKSKYKIENMPEEYIEDLKFVREHTIMNSGEALELLNCLDMYNIPVGELERMAAEYNGKKEEMKSLTYALARRRDNSEEISRLIKIRDSFPSKEEIDVFNEKAHREFEEKQKEYKKQHGFLGFLRRIFQRQKKLGLESPPGLKIFYYEGFHSIEALESKLSKMQQSQEEYDKMQEKFEILQSDINENERNGETAERILKFKRSVARARASEKDDKSIDMID